MMKRLTVALAALILGLTAIPAAGAGAAQHLGGSPRSQPKPVPGTYAGFSSQKKTVTASVTRNAVRQIMLNYRIGCSKRSRQIHLVGSVTVTQLPVKQLAFATRFHVRDGQLYKIAGVFTTSGRVKGTMSVTLNSARYGTCRTGLISWTASI
jgi:hypothetical protein